MLGKDAESEREMSLIGNRQSVGGSPSPTPDPTPERPAPRPGQLLDIYDTTAVGNGAGGVTSPTGAASLRSPRGSYSPPKSPGSPLPDDGSPSFMMNASQRIRVLDLSIVDTSPLQPQRKPENKLQAAFTQITEFKLFPSYVSRRGKIWCGVVSLVSAAIIAMAFVMYAEVLKKRRSYEVHNQKECVGVRYEEPRVNNLAYSIGNIVVAALFMMWFAVRSIRQEKEALLFCFGVVAAVLVARCLYLAFGLMRPEMFPELELPVKVVFCIASFATVMCLLMARSVSSVFGWRNYYKGVTVVNMVAEMRRYKQLDACIKLDTFLCTNVFLSIFFLMDNNADRVYGSVVTLLTVASMMTVTFAIKRDLTWYVWVWLLIGLALPSYYIYVIHMFLSRNQNHCDVAFAECYSDAQGGTDVNAAVEACCVELGTCEFKESFVKDDRVLMLVLAFTGCLLRAVTLLLGFRVMRSMRAVNFKQVWQRSKENIRSHFQL